MRLLYSYPVYIIPLVMCGILGNVEQCVLAAAQSKHSKSIYLQDLGGGDIDTILD